MSRYRTLHVRFWHDEKIASLDHVAQRMFLYLLTGPQSTPIGVTVVGEGALLDACVPTEGMLYTWAGASVPSYDLLRRVQLASEAMEQLVTRGLVWRDGSVHVLPNFMEYNPPHNPNEVASWRHALEELPACALYARLRDHLRARGSMPKFLYDMLLDPLADGCDGARLGAVIKGYVKRKPGSRKIQRNRGHAKRSREGSPEPCLDLTGAGAGTGVGMLEVESQVCGGGVGLEDGSKAAGGARAAQAQRVPPAAGGEGKLEPLIFDYDAGTVGKWSRKPTKAEGARWREAYPGIDVVREFHAATRWLEAHRTQRKKRFDQFLLRWFSKAQAAVDRRM